MDSTMYTALEQVLTHTRDAVFKKQTLELEKLQRKFDRLNYSHQSLIEYTCNTTTIPCYCEGCGRWDHPDDDETPYYFFKFYSELSSIFYDPIGDEPRRRTWVLEKVFLCHNCAEPLNTTQLEGTALGPEFQPQFQYLKLCTKYKLSYWLEDVSDVAFRAPEGFVGDEDFLDVEGRRAQSNYHLRKFEFFYAAEEDYLDVYGRDKMHHIAAYIIQRAFRSGWDYRRANRFSHQDE